MADPSPNARRRDIEKAVPLWRPEREACLEATRRYARQCDLVPPLSLDELEEHVTRILEAEGFPSEWRGFLMVLFNNEVWRDTLAAVPYERRLLLLPQCLRSSAECPAERDDMGLLCQACGRCPIGELQSLAEQLGYLVLVAEGATLVVRLLDQGVADAVVGVSCLSALERSFPQTVANAIPSLAIPLYVDGCADTKADIDWIREMIALSTESGWRQSLDTESLRARVREWFTPDALAETLGRPETHTEQVAIDWLAGAGKRWRPLLVAVAAQALAEDPAGVLTAVRPLGVAVECFHKASLIHDDIEDNDIRRDGQPTLHVREGVPVAVNAGDLLIGEGYRLIAQSGFAPETRARLAEIAADAHRTLCIGQGEELDAARRDIPPTPARMLEIFRRKTSPAFAAALKIGAVAAGGDAVLCAALDAFSDALGIAYQIRDDIADHQAAPEAGAPRPSLSLLSALAWEAGVATPDPPVFQKAELLLEHYRNEAIRNLSAFRNAELKSVLRRMVERLLKPA